MAAAASSHVVLEELLKEFECSICMERLRNPRCLICQHAFCHECLESCIQSGREDENRITCPVCRNVTRLSRAGVGGLKTNPLINSALAKLAGWKDESTSNEASKSDSNRKRSDSTCKTHPQMPASHYCTTCDRICCKLCLNTGHKSHRHTTLQQKVSRIKHAMQQLVEQCNDKNIAIQTAHHEVNFQKEKGLEEVQKLKTELRQKAEKIKGKITMKENELIHRLDAMAAKVEQEIGEKQANCLKLEQGLQTTVEKWGAIQQSDDPEIVRQTESIQSKMRELVNSHVCTNSEFITFLMRSGLHFVPDEQFLEITNHRLGGFGELEVCKQWNRHTHCEHYEGGVSQLMFMSDGRLVAGYARGGMEIWEPTIESYECECSAELVLDCDDLVRDLTVLSNNDIVYQNSCNEIVLIRSGSPVKKLGKFDGQWVSVASFSLQSKPYIAVYNYVASRNTTCQTIYILDTDGEELDRLNMSYNTGLRHVTFDCNRRHLFIDYDRKGVHWPDIPNGSPDILKIAEKDQVYLAVACNQSVFVYVASQSVHTPNMITISKHSLEDGRLVDTLLSDFRVSRSFNLKMANWKDQAIAFSTGGNITILYSEEVEWTTKILSQF